MPNRPWIRRLACYCAVAIVAVVAAAWVLAEGALHPRFELPPATPPDRYEEASVTAADGAVLRGWMGRPVSVDPERRGAVLLHGVGACRSDVLGQAELLRTRGYTVLLPDIRAHGRSGGEIATFGLLERGDLRRWIDLLERKEHVSRIYGFGASMGAAILLQTLPVEPRLRAVAAEAGFATFREVAYDRVTGHLGWRPPITRALVAPVVETALLLTRLRYGYDLAEASPLQAITESQTPVLLIHGTADTNIPPEHARQLSAARGSNALWLVPGAGHCTAFGKSPQEYSSRIVAWFASH